MNNKVFYYARVSSQNQNLDRQIQAFKELGADDREIICDKESGKDFNREGYQALKNTLLRSGDVLVIKSLDRLSRNKEDIKQELEWFKNQKIRLKILDLPTTLIDYNGQEWLFEMVNNILIEVISSLSQYERENIRKRQAEGIEAARKSGKHLGRPKLELPENADEILEAWKNRKITARHAMEQLRMGSSAFYNLVKERGIQKIEFFQEKVRNQTL